MRAYARDHLGGFLRGTLDAQLNMVETRVAKTPQLIFVEQRAAGYQVGIEILHARVLNQLDKIVAKDRLAARERQLHHAEFCGLSKSAPPFVSREFGARDIEIDGGATVHTS